MINSEKYGFISYSRIDRNIVERVVKDLKLSGFSLWIDSDIEPGTSDWESSIRKAISNAKVVIYFGSPSARESTYVKDELSLAERHKLGILPVWIGGNHWIDCVPLGKSTIQYIDLRENYDTQLKKLIDTMRSYLSSKPSEINLSTLVKRILGKNFGNETTLRSTLVALDDEAFPEWGFVYELFYEHNYRYKINVLHEEDLSTIQR